MYTLKNIAILDDPYGLEQVNCLEKPVGIALNSYNKSYYSLFLIFHKMVQSYKVNYYYQKNIHKWLTMQRIPVVLERELGLKLKCDSDYDDFSEFINQHLAKNNPVLVPANLKELYYSAYYRTSDWMHIYLLIAYNAKTDLYSTFDYTQVYQDFSNYYKFPIPTDTLNRIYNSSREVLNADGIYHFESNEIPENLDENQLVKKCLYMLCFERLDEPFLEKDILLEAIETKELPQNATRKFFNIFHYKEVLFRELNNFFEGFAIDEAIKEEFKKRYQTLLGVIQKVVPQITYQLYKKNYDRANEKFELIIEEETKLNDVLLKIYRAFPESQMRQETIEVHQAIYNNQDNNIEITSDDSLSFKFKTEKTYNNWFSDEAPRVIYFEKKEEEIGKKIIFGADFEVTKQTVDSLYMVGIYVKTKKDSKYLFGIHSGNSICIERTGVNAELARVPNLDKEVRLDIEVIGNKVILLRNGKQFLEDDNFVLDDQIVELGITCKTWGAVKPIEIEVTNITRMEAE